MCLDVVLGISLASHSCHGPPGCRLHPASYGLRDYSRRNVILTI